MKRLVLLGLLASPAAAEVPEWAGYWAAEPEWCAQASRIGSVTPAPIYLADTEMLGHENSCDIVFTEPGPMPGTYVQSLMCQSEGSEYDEDQMLFLSGDGDVLHIWSGAFMTRFERCL